MGNDRGYRLFFKINYRPIPHILGKEGHILYRRCIAKAYPACHTHSTWISISVGLSSDMAGSTRDGVVPTKAYIMEEFVA